MGRLLGAGIGTSLWTIFQYLGHEGYLDTLLKSVGVNRIGPWGNNIFEPPEVYLFNILIGLASSLTPYVVDYVASLYSKFEKDL